MDRKLRLALTLQGGRAAAVLTAAALLLIPECGKAQGQPSQQQHLPPASYQPQPPDGQTDEEKLEKAGQIATQPVRDVGISKNRIPPALQEAVAAPYAPPRRQDCRWLLYELARLNQALGPDFDLENKPQEDKVERLAFAGGEMVVNSLIPFRGIVREISGAASADRRKTAAVNAGLARRGYVRGLAQAQGCKVPVSLAAR